MFHGLEGSSASHYAKAFGLHARACGCSLVVVHFRGCSGEINRKPRAYHSGDHAEIDWVLRSIRKQNPIRTVLAVGISLGGNALLRWVAEQGERASGCVDAVMAVSAPLDLTVSGNALDKGLNSHLYTPMFLSSMKRKAKAKWEQFPGLFDLGLVSRATTLRAFDDAFTAPLHGFGTVARYWKSASALPHLARIRIPTCVLNARNDPFVPAGCLPASQWRSAFVDVVQPAAGGHVGFWHLPAVRLSPRARLKNLTLPQYLFAWAKQKLSLGIYKDIWNG
jgi:predicted alpha/beta-fold hydrolase